MRNFLGTPFRHVVFVFLLPFLLLSGCEGPKVTVVVNRLKPGMLKGKTVGVEGLNITSAYWPGKFIEEPILDKAEKDLQHRLKDAHVCLLNEYGTIQENLERGKDATALAKTLAKEPDYIFRIMLKADSLASRDVIGRDAYSMRGGASARGGGIMPGLRSPGYRSGGSLFGAWGTADFSSYSWRKIAKRTLKADYILSDARTFKLIWRAEAVSTDVHVSVNNSVFGYRSPPYQSSSDLELKLPLNPLWVSMNAAAVRTIKK